MRRSVLKQRPEWFSLNRSHPLSRGLVFAGLGRVHGSGKYLDSSPYGNHGTTSGIAIPATATSGWTWVPQLGRWGMRFDGTDGQYIGCPNPNILGSNWTISFWSSRTTAFKGMVRCANGIRMSLVCYTSGTALYAVAYNLAANYYDWRNDAVVSTGQHHYSFTFSDSDYQLSVYIDGALKSDTGASGLSADNTTGLDWGCGASRNYVTIGSISDGIIHKRILSPAEIQQLADPSNVMLSGLILPPRRRVFASAGAAPATTIIWPWQQRHHRRVSGVR
jgi:hypothetical protein